MRLDTRAPVDLLAVAAFLFVAVAVVLADVWGPLRVVFALPLVLFAPGYAITAALFPRENRSPGAWHGVDEPARSRETVGLDRLERFALSIGLSIAAVALVGLGLTYTPWGLQLGPVLAALTVLTVAACAVSFRRRRNLPWEEQPRFRFHPSGRWRSASGPQRLWVVALLAAALVTAGTLTFVMTTDRRGDAFTEFYILDDEGNAAEYPTKLAPGENATVVVAVANREHRATDYTVNVTSQRGEFVRDGDAFVPLESQALGSWEVSLDHEDREMRAFNFSLEEEGMHRVRFALGLEGAEEEPYRALHLWVEVEA